MKKLLLFVVLIPFGLYGSYWDTEYTVNEEGNWEIRNQWLPLGEELFSMPVSLPLSAETGNFEDVKKLVVAGEDVNKVDSDGFSAFYLACQNNHLEVALYLLVHGANPLLVPEDEGVVETPVHHAIAHGNVELCEAIIKHICLPHMPVYKAKSLPRVRMALWVFKQCMKKLYTHEVSDEKGKEEAVEPEQQEISNLPRELRIRILCIDQELVYDVLGILFGKDQKEPISNKMARAIAVLGSANTGRLLSVPCREDIQAVFSMKGGLMSKEVSAYAQECCKKTSETEDEQKRRKALADLFNPDSLNERLPGLIIKWFAPQDNSIAQDTDQSG